MTHHPTFLSLEQLELLPDDRKVRLLLDLSEDQWFDRKSASVDARALADRLIGFANADGGLIVIGIANKRIEGTAKAGPAKLNELRQAAVDFSEPPVRIRVEEVPCRNVQSEADRLLLIEIEVSDQVHRNVKGEVFLRIGDENRKLGIRESQELEFDKGQSVYDGQPVPGARFSDLDPSLVSQYLRKLAQRSGSRAEEVLEARGLLVTRRGRLVPTISGVLLLGARPQKFMPEATLRLLRYRGASRETGARANVERDTILGGTLAAQIDSALRRVRRLLPGAIRLQPTGRFEPTAVVPESAWLEAVVNAVVHRSYSLAGDHIRVEVFSDRLEVESPGRLPGLVRIENIRSTRFARNPRIARAMADLGFGRELGEGVNRMFEEMERAGFPPPLYTQGPASVRVTFLFESVFGRMLQVLPLGAERFVEHLSRTGRVTTTEAMDLLGMSRPTALSWLRALADAKLVQHVGTSLKDPRGFWQPGSAAPPVASHRVRRSLSS